MFLGKLAEVPLYALDLDDLRRKSTTAWTAAFGTLSTYNAGLLVDALPMRVLRDNGLDFDGWYPIWRRVLWSTSFLRALKRDREQFLEALDILRDRFDLRGGVVVAKDRLEKGVGG
jgi:hypothetical protein